MTTQVTKELQKGDWVLIGTQEADDDASLTQTGLNSTYDIYCIVLSSFVPDTDANDVRIQFGDSSGIDSGASDYVSGRQVLEEGSTTYSYGDFAAGPSIRLCTDPGTGANEGVSSINWIMNPGDAGTRNTIFGTYSLYDSTPELRGGTIMGMRETAITLDRILVKFNNGNITSGRLTVWGLSHD